MCRCYHTVKNKDMDTDMNKDMNSNKYDENTIAEAKKKLACKIVPPEMTGESVSGGQCDADKASGKVRLTQMTTAGG